MENYLETTINRCQPGYNASCSLCCGSHNYTMPSEQIENLFLKRSLEYTESRIKQPEESCIEKLFPEVIQCANVGMQLSDPRLTGCLKYYDLSPEKKIETFFNGTCKTFLCPAWYNLSDRQVLFAARLMADWYYYSLFINDIESVHEICAEYINPEDVDDERLISLKEELFERFLAEDGK